MTTTPSTYIVRSYHTTSDPHVIDTVEIDADTFALTRDDLIVWHDIVERDGRWYDAVRVTGEVYNRADRESPYRATAEAVELGHAPAIFAAERLVATSRDDLPEPVTAWRDEADAWARRVLGAAGYQPGVNLYMAPIGVA